MEYSKIILGKGKEFSLQRKHPWVFSGAISKKDNNLADGDIVEVYSQQNQFLGMGYFSNGGSISVRIISFEKTIIDEDFWFKKINKAWQYRLHLGILNERTNVCRLFFGEGDGVPGLILDYYDGHVVLQAHSWGVYMQKDNIVAAVKKILGTSLKSMYDKSAETLNKHHAEKTKNGFIVGELDSEIIVKENDHLFKIDFINGQKTGFFIDQRDNRKLLGDYSKGKNVLNTFCYTGGFSVYAAAAGAAMVHSVDSSQSAIDLCNKNIELNTVKNNESYAIDTFEFLKDKQNIYDVIVLDPPAFAKSRDSKHNAVIGYKRLNALAIKLIKPNGIIFTYSCSGVVDKYLFYNTITAAAIEAGRNVKVLHYMIQPADHPVTPYFAEGEYLKGMVLWVE
ncbi:MAG: class I SAM-dependent rRNA methyltransferase [Bacteroidetes bacterium]|nr:class I SAM-dependent rRNA methyltransferase [Bacteroidota bacterium]